LKVAGDPLAELAYATRSSPGDREAARGWARAKELRRELHAAEAELARERLRCEQLERRLRSIGR
jgi:hypothetical protein